MSLFSSLDVLPPDPILGIAVAFRADSRSEKINLGVGAYRDENNLPYVLKSVRAAEKKLLDDGVVKEYLPIEGDQEFIRLTEKLIFGTSSPSECFSAQTPGASGALAVGARFLAKSTSKKEIFFSNPTWPNHPQIFSTAGFSPHYYPYYSKEKSSFDREGFFRTFENMEEGTPFLIQGSCHNPCGIDLENNDWERLAGIVKKRHLIPFFDMAYQGFGTNIDKDVFAIRLFAAQGIEMLIAYSYSKNMGLYGERTGMLTIVGGGRGIGSQVKHIIRTLYSSPPLHGALVVKTILGDPALEQVWRQELNMMRQRILTMRQTLAESLPQFSFILQQQGMFSYTGLSKAQVLRLKDEKGIYMPDDGRINVAGLTRNNLPYVIEAIKGVL